MLTSISNPKVKAVRALQSRARTRRERGQFVVEGVRLTEEALRAALNPELLFYTSNLDSQGAAVVEGFRALGAKPILVSEEVMAAVSDTETPQGLLAVLSQNPLPLPTKPDFLLILDGIRDPGNLGTTLRTASAAGVDAVLLPPGAVDIYAPKVVRAGMGAHFHLPVHGRSWHQIEQVLGASNRSAGLHLFLADAQAETLYTRADFRQPLALLVGGEAVGAGKRAKQLPHLGVSIPMHRGVESLNAAVAAAVLMFEVVRQRSV